MRPRVPARRDNRSVFHVVGILGHFEIGSQPAHGRFQTIFAIITATTTADSVIVCLGLHAAQFAGRDYQRRDASARHAPASLRAVVWKAPVGQLQTVPIGLGACQALLPCFTLLLSSSPNLTPARWPSCIRQRQIDCSKDLRPTMGYDQPPFLSCFLQPTTGKFLAPMIGKSSLLFRVSAQNTMVCSATEYVASGGAFRR